MSKNSKTLLTDEEISKAMDVLNQFNTGEVDSIEKSTDNDLSDIDQQIADLQAKKEQRLQKSTNNDINPEPAAQVDAIVKAVADELSTKFEAFANISKSILDSHDDLSTSTSENAKRTDDLSKAIDGMNEKFDLLQKSIQEIADSPMGKLGSFKSVKGVERFAESRENNGKETLSITRDKRVILGRLMKSLDTEEGVNRIGNVVGLVENGYVNEDNFGLIQKSLQNELGVDVNIVF